MTKNIMIFDFDGTLTSYPLPKFDILIKCGYENGLADVKFISKVMTKIPKYKDTYSALYETFLRVIAKSSFSLTDDIVAMGVENIKFNDGVPEFLKVLKDNGIKSYILSSGIKPYLEKSSIGQLVSGIYATTFSYNSDGEIAGLRFCMSDRKKVNAIRAILKKNDISVQDARSVIYFGDGLTDIPAMKYIKKCGGTTIFVVDVFNQKDINYIKEKGIVDLFIEKDFTVGSELYNLIIRYCNIDPKNK